MEVNRKKIPEKFYCERCDARPVNALRAKQIQEKYLKSANKSPSSATAKRRNSSSSVGMSPPKSEAADSPLKQQPIDNTSDETTTTTIVTTENNTTNSKEAPTTNSNKIKRRYKTKTIREEFESQSNNSSLQKDEQTGVGNEEERKTSLLYSDEFLRIKNRLENDAATFHPINQDLPFKLVKFNSNKTTTTATTNDRDDTNDNENEAENAKSAE